jgi:hypothetical protein
MIMGRSVLAWAVAVVSFVALAGQPAEASSFNHFNYDKYLPASLRSVIRPYLGKTSAAGQQAAAPTDHSAAPTPQGKSSCLSKEYLASGAVLFKDVCTGQWAINSTANPQRSPADENCLTKEAAGNNFVMFRDRCTQEWAMNALEPQAGPPR